MNGRVRDMCGLQTSIHIARAKRRREMAPRCPVCAKSMMDADPEKKPPAGLVLAHHDCIEKLMLRQPIDLDPPATPKT